MRVFRVPFVGPNNGEILAPFSACCLLDRCRHKVLRDHFLAFDAGAL